MIQGGQQALEQEKTLEWPRDGGIMFLAPWETQLDREGVPEAVCIQIYSKCKGKPLTIFFFNINLFFLILFYF